MDCNGLRGQSKPFYELRALDGCFSLEGLYKRVRLGAAPAKRAPHKHPPEAFEKPTGKGEGECLQ